MPNILKVTVENADELLNPGAYDAGALIQIQSATTEAGAFADISGTGATPTVPLVSGTRVYTGYDPAGTSSTWYQTRFKNAGATRVSDWTAAFQVGDEQGALLCSLYDARQALQQHNPTDTSQDENILDWIRQVSTWIAGQVGRSLTPDPLSGTKTYRFHTRAGMVLQIPRGIRTLTTLGIASTDQPASGGIYTAVDLTKVYIDPPQAERDYGWPGNRLVLLRTSGLFFYDASFGAEVTGSFGWAAVPSDIQAIALNLVIASAREAGASGADTVTIGIGGERTYERALSGKDWRTLGWYRARQAG